MKSGNIRFISADLEWTEGMKTSVQSKIVEPLERHMKDHDFELAVHFEVERRRKKDRQPSFEMCLVMKTFDGHRSEVVRRRGEEFHSLVNEVSNVLRARVRKSRRRFFVNPFKGTGLSAGPH